MRFEGRSLAAMVGAFLLLFAAGAGLAQTTTTETKNFEVISVDGNKVVARDASGAKEYTLPDDFRFNVGGKQLSVHELKPGMKGTATITTMTTTVPVYVTEVRNGQVVKADADMVILKGEKGGYQMFEQGDVDRRKIQMLRNGKSVKLNELRVGDRLTATLVTEGTPQVLTEKEVKATIAHHDSTAPAATAKAAAPSEEMAAPSTAAAEPAETGSYTQKTLPPTASSLPLLALIGMASLAVVFVLRSRRLRG